MASKIDRALYGPSMTEVILGAFLSLLLGGALAAVYLVTKPVQTVRELPKEPVPGVVYHFEGSRDSTKGRFWKAKQQQLMAGRSITLTEDELNTAAAGLKSPPPKKGADEAEPKKEMLSAGPPNFRISEGVLQVAMPVTNNTYDLGLSALVQAQGTFVKSGDRHVFVPAALLVGSCRVEKLPFIADFVLGKIHAALDVPAELATVWGTLSEVKIDGAQLQLTP